MAKFLGVTMTPKSFFTHGLAAQVHISSVALDDGDYSKLYLTVAGQRYLVATLNSKMKQMALDLNFVKGDDFKFENSGNGKLSLLGYQHPSDIAESDDSSSGSGSGSDSDDDSASNSDDDAQKDGSFQVDENGNDINHDGNSALMADGPMNSCDMRQSLKRRFSE